MRAWYYDATHVVVKSPSNREIARLELKGDQWFDLELKVNVAKTLADVEAFYVARQAKIDKAIKDMA